MIGNFSLANSINSNWPGLANFFMSNSFTGGILKKILNIAPQRPLPLLSPVTLSKWAKKHSDKLLTKHVVKGEVYLFCDEYTNYNESDIGIKTIKLLTSLGFNVKLVDHMESGRTFISKGLLRAAKKVAIKNVKIFKDLITDRTPLLGIEPSAILTFRDEYPVLVGDELKGDAERISKNCLLVDEFIAQKIGEGLVTPASFTKEPRSIKLHGHCHQKALSSVDHSRKILSLPINYKVEVIPSGCCGMAGSFGYEKEHYDVSLKIGELILFPAIRKATAETIIAAPGTSCRHQIKDGTGRRAQHTIEVLYEALEVR
jgi:Fe-S oxidoreductase